MKKGPYCYPSRICYNFLEKCNMSCPLCYCPFDGKKSGFDMWKAIIDQVYDWSIKSVTFGGGDPFMYPDFSKLLAYTYKKFDKKLFIQVDTNGLSLNRKYYPVVLKTVNLLGLPLEGSIAEINQIIRKNKRHFHVILRLLEIFNEFNLNIKINTVVCRYNINDLEDIGALITKYSIKIWSLYEYWALDGNRVENKNDNQIPHDIFWEKANFIKKKFNNIKIEIGSIDDRKNAYFFVSQTGRAYTIKKDNPNQYIEIGSIFDIDVLSKWQNHSNYEKNILRFSSRCNI